MISNYVSVGDEADDVLYSKLQRLGSETVLRRYNEKRRTLSAASSDYDPTYSNLNEMRGGINITRTSKYINTERRASHRMYILTYLAEVLLGCPLLDFISIQTYFLSNISYRIIRDIQTSCNWT